VCLVKLRVKERQSKAANGGVSFEGEKIRYQPCQVLMVTSPLNTSLSNPFVYHNVTD